ncbi:MAG: DUF2059 domain-containing protein [Hylemonella sp.]|nr:DUF2059 domain-containing protein [Hylemonella sp.]
MQANFSLKFAIIFAAGIGLSTAVGAQNTSAASTTANAAAPASDAAKALATKMVALQNGPEMDRMVYQLTSGAMQPLIAKWAPKMEALPASKQDKAREQLNTELKKTGDTTKKIIEGQMAKSANSVLEKAYLERFTEDELKAIVAMFESPIFKKYQSVAPELGNVWVKDVIDNSRGAVLAEGKSFDDIAAKIVDEKSSNASTKTAPAKAAATKK